MNLALVFALIQLGGGLFDPRARAELAFRRAQDGRDMAASFLCGDPDRLARLTRADRQFDRLRGQFAQRFGEGWRDPQQRGQARPDPGERDRCVLRDQFTPGMLDYENSLRQAEAVLPPGP